MIENTSKRAKILEKAFGSCSISGNEILFHCPKCNSKKKKFSINPTKGKDGVYKCWVCGYSGNSIYSALKVYGRDFLQEWIEEIGFVDSLTYEEKINNFCEERTSEEKRQEKVTLPNEFISIVGNEHRGGLSQAIEYLFGRGLTIQDIYLWKLGVCLTGEYRDCIIIPSFSSDGRLNFFVARKYAKDYKKYIMPKICDVSKDIIFNHLWIDFSKPIVIVEGVFDAIFGGENCVPLLGSFLNDKGILYLEIVRHKTPVYMAMDPDASRKEFDIINKFLKNGITVYKVDISGYKDVGEMGAKEFLKRKKDAELVDEFLILKKMIKL